MKNLVTLALAITVAASLYALPDTGTPIRTPHRFFELGIDEDIGVSNNALNAKECLVKDLVIDLRELADNMPSTGFDINAIETFKFYGNLNLKNQFHLGMTAGIDSSVYGNISKELFDFLGYGNKMNETLDVSGKVNADVFFYQTLETSFKAKNILFTLTPAVFAPIAHAETSDMKGKVENGSDGSVKLSASTKVIMYTVTDAQSIIEDKTFNTNAIVDDVLHGLGFDLSLAAEMPFPNYLELGLYTRIPIVPGTLKYSASMTATASYTTDNIAGYITDTNTTTKDFTISDKTYESADFKLSRPFRFGIEGAWRPFGNWFTMTPLFGIGIKYPYTADAVPYVEYNFDMDAELFHILGIHASTGYFNQVFVHQAGVMFNFRVIEIDADVSLQGSDMQQSWKGSGAGAKIRVKMGF